MDFLIGGLPRGGTTIAADLFNYHPQAFCLAQESQVLPLCMRLADSAPVAHQHINLLRAAIGRDVTQVLHAMAGHNVARGAAALAEAEKKWNIKAAALPQRLVFDEQRAQRLADRLGDLFEAGLFGKELLVAALAELEAEIRKDVTEHFVGEKSPANVFAIERFGLLGARMAMIMKREPFGFMRSMRQLGDDAGGHFAGAFRKSIWEMIGMYCEYAETISRLETSPKMIVADYAELLDSPKAIVQRMFDAAGLPSAEGAAAHAAKWVRPQSGRQSWDAFSPAELALIWGLTAEARRNLGHDQAYYTPRGLARAPSASDYCVESNSAHVLYGLSATGNKDHLWVADTGRIAVESLPECKRVTLKFWANFPTAILPEGAAATINILAGDPERLIASAEIAGGKARHFELSVNLWDIPPLLQAKGGAVRLLTLASSHSYKSINIPAHETGDGIGTADSRRVSVIMRAPAFE